MTASGRIRKSLDPNDARVRPTAERVRANMVVVLVDVETELPIPIPGAVRAMEGRGFAAEDIIGIGINGQDLADFQKTKPTGFFASVLLSPRRHGYETAEWMYKWLTVGTAPPKATYTEGVLITRDNYKAVMAEQGF